MYNWFWLDPVSPEENKKKTEKSNRPIENSLSHTA